MTWREQWPGEPRRTELNEEDEEDSGPFSIALKPSACEASPAIAALREESGEVLTYESEGDAAKILIDDIDCSGLQFQAPAPNDPAEVDAYLVKLRDPDPSSAERGPPEDGWTFNMRAQQVGHSLKRCSTHTGGTHLQSSPTLRRIWASTPRSSRCR